MPVRNGKWVPWSTIEAERKAAEAAAPKAEEPTAEEDAPKAKRPRRSKKAAEAAIADATGAQVDLDAEPSSEEQEEQYEETE